MVKAFQEKYNLPVTGIFTYSDWTVLKNAYRNILKSFPTEYQDYINELYPDYFLVRGSTGPDVKNVKKGDRILYREYSATEVKVNGEEYLIIKEEDILATL